MDDRTPPLVLKTTHFAEGSELRILKKLAGAHESLVVPEEFGEADGWFFQVSEYFPLGGLNAHLVQHTNGLPPTDCLLLLRQVVDALSALHSMQIVHCDLKPSNIFMRTARGVGTTIGYARSNHIPRPDKR